MDGSAQKAATGYDFGRAREFNPERKKDLPKETTRNEDRWPRRKESPADARDGLSPPVKIKDIQVDTVRRTARPNEGVAPTRKVLGEDDEDEPLKQRQTPPYTKPVANKATSSSSDESDSSNGKGEPTVDEVLKGKPMVKSVRTRHTKPSPGEEVAGGDEMETVKGVVNKENVAQGRRILKFFDGGRGRDEEKMMDKLLRHYSKKKGSNKNGKSEAELKLPPMDSSKDKNLRGQDGPNRASSLRVKPTSPAEIDPRKHSRAASFHPDQPNAHVHPKLPDYDEFVARLAAFRGK